MLDYFSRVYFAGLVVATIWSFSTVFQFVRSIRSSKDLLGPDRFALSMLDRRLKSLFDLSVILAGACAANQILGVSRVYMIDRFTDANPAYALDEAWVVSQIIAGILLLLLQSTGIPPPWSGALIESLVDLAVSSLNSRS
jgi:hypothetical protein